MFNIVRQLELPQQLIWKFAHEPELLGWTIKARNYNTFVANCMFASLLLILYGLTMFLYSAYHDMGQLNRILACGFFFIVMLFALMSMTHQRVSFAYRFSESGVEYCEWKDFPKWALPFLKWVSIFTAIIFLYMATIDPGFLIGALVGPGGMALMYLRMTYSKSYREMHTEYHHHEFKWEKIIQLAVATNREVVDLRYTFVYEGDDYESEWNFNIFCKKGQKEAVASFIRPYLSPDTPFVRDKVDVPLSTRRPD